MRAGAPAEPASPGPGSGPRMNHSDRRSPLPGGGRSTAAIAVFAYGERAAILDGNVQRVLTRALGFGDDLATAAGRRALWAHAESMLPRRGIRAYKIGRAHV